MALANRVIGEFGELAIGGENFETVFQNVLLEATVAVRENKAVKDTLKHPKELRRGYRLTWTVAAEDDDALPLMAALGTAAGVIEHEFTWTPYGTDADLPTIKGDCILARVAHTADESQSRSYEARIQGLPTYDTLAGT